MENEEYSEMKQHTTCTSSSPKPRWKQNKTSPVYNKKTKGNQTYWWTKGNRSEHKWKNRKWTLKSEPDKQEEITTVQVQHKKKEKKEEKKPNKQKGRQSYVIRYSILDLNHRQEMTQI